MKRFCLMLVFLLVGAVPVMAQGGDVEIIGGENDPGALREMLSYMAAPGMVDGSIKIYVGSLPEGDSRNVPLPDDSVITGSIQSKYGYPPDDGVLFTQVYYSSPLSPEALIAFYEDTMTAQNWSIDVGRPGFGFVSRTTLNQQFCQPDGDRMFLDVTASQDLTGQTRVSLQYTWGNAFECATNVAEAAGQGIYVLIPSLETPEGVTIATSHNEPPLQGGGSGGGSNFANVSAFLRSALTADEIIALYNPQLEAQGWTLVENLTIPGMASSNWTLYDEDGNIFGGMLTLKSSPVGEDLYYAELVIQRKPK